MKHFLLILTLAVATLSILGMVTASDVELIFSHKFHAEQVGAECSSCHSAETSTAAGDNLLPSMETCYVCHDQNNTECSLCHKDPDNAVAYPRIATYIAKFPHDRHAEHGAGCSTCHVGVETSVNIFDQHLPDMAVCQTCHKDMAAVDYCSTCHGKGEQLAPADHRLDWRQAHGSAAQLEKEKCERCHIEKQCLDCHQQDNLDRPVHPLNFIHSHALEAKTKRDNCYTCHEEQESCLNCHREQLVMPRNHNTAGWSNAVNGGRHAKQAELDLDNCLACHNDHNGEPVCAECHQAKKQQ